MRRVTLRGLMARKLRLVLTALAIVLGVTFVTGTLVLGDTLNRTVNNLIGTVYSHVSFEVRGTAQFNSNSAAGIDSTANRRPVPESIAAAVRRVPGVEAAYGSVGGYAQFVGHDGKLIGKAGAAEGFSFDPYRQLSSVSLVAGRAPSGPHDVVMDLATARDHHYRIGDSVRVLLPGPSQTFTVTGFVKFGSADNLLGTTLAAFALPTAQRLFDSVGHYDTINVLAKPGVDDVALQRAIARVLPHGVEVVSGQEVANQLTSSVDSELSILSTLLLIFALISLFVGAFTIFNTFSITVGQRTRELALLRVVGASRRQVFRSVLGEAALVGLLASLIGLGIGVLAALGLKALLKAFGIALPSAPLVFEWRTPVVALAVGIGVTVISAVVPARRAVRVPPVAALMATVERPAPVSRRRQLLGAALAVLAIVAIAAGVSGAKIALVGIGAALALIATAMIVPVIAQPLASALGRPLQSLGGMPGRLGRENATRNPGRTAQTAAALLIGMALVSTIAVLGTSLSTSTGQQIDSAVRADYLVTGNSVSTHVPGLVARLPGVAATTSVYRGQFEVRGSLQTLGAVPPAGIEQTVNLNLTVGDEVAALTAGELLIDTTTASSDGLHVGSTVPVRFAQTGATTMRVGGIFKPNPLVGSYLTGTDFFVAHFNAPTPSAVLVATAPGATGVGPALKRALAPYPNLKYQTRAQFESSQKSQINTLLGLVYVLLALAVLVAVIGIVNTLMLSVFERTREIGLLRAVGMKRRQLQRMIRAESVIIAVFGAVIGIVLGTVLGACAAGALRNNGVTAVSIPIADLVGFLILSGLLGLLAATWPARRVAGLDVLRAIATE